jgi:hypothetical protein
VKAVTTTEMVEADPAKKKNAAIPSETTE